MADTILGHESGRPCHSIDSDSEDSSPEEILGLDSYLTDNRHKRNDNGSHIRTASIVTLPLLPFPSNANFSDCFDEQKPEPPVQIPTPEAEMAPDISQQTVPPLSPLPMPMPIHSTTYTAEETDDYESTEVGTEPEELIDQPAPELSESSAATTPSQVNQQKDNRRGALGHKKRKAMPRYCIACSVNVSRAKTKAHCRSEKHIENVFAFQLKKRGAGGDLADKDSDQMDTKSAHKPWRRPRKPVDDRKPPALVKCEVCEVDLQSGSIRGHNRSKNHILLHKLHQQFTPLPIHTGNRILRRSTRTASTKAASTTTGAGKRTFYTKTQPA